MRRWTGAKRDIEFSVKELREMLQLGDKDKTFNSFETNILVFTVKDNDSRNYLKLYNKIQIDESVLWLDYIKVENKVLLERLELKYSDMNFDSHIVKSIFHKSYDKTLNKDNRFVMIQDKKGKINFVLFNHIVSG